jgi:hypothetical protein
MRVWHGASRHNLLAIALVLTTQLAGIVWVPVARAAEQETRACEFEVKARCVSGDAQVTLADGVVTKIVVKVFWCGLRRDQPPFACTIDSSRTDEESVWSQEGSATVVTNRSPWNPSEPDRVKVTVGREVSIEMAEAQSLGRCGAGAELPRTIVIPAQKGACRVQLQAR